MNLDPKVGSETVDTTIVNGADSGPAKKAARDYKRGLIEDRARIQQQFQQQLDEIDAELYRVDIFLGEAQAERRGERVEFAPEDIDPLVEIARRNERGVTITEMYGAARAAGLSLAQGERGQQTISAAMKSVERTRLYRTAGGKWKARVRPA